MKILMLDHGETMAGGQIMFARLLPRLRERFRIDALVGCPLIQGNPIPKTYRGLRKAMRGGYDLIYANTARTAIAAATTGRPFLWHKHLPESTFVQRIAARRARRVISVCKLGAPPGDHVRVIYNGVPPQTAEPATDLPAGRKVLLLGRVEREKGHDLAVEAIERMETDATLVVAGPGDWYLPESDKVAFLGLRRDVPRLLAACDVLLNASRFDEGAPLVVLEAQMAGLPIVATRVGGTPEIVREGETAFLVPREDAGAMAAALDRALAVDREQWASAAAEQSKQFTIEACAERVAAVIEECLEPVPA